MNPNVVIATIDAILHHSSTTSTVVVATLAGIHLVATTQKPITKDSRLYVGVYHSEYICMYVY